MRATKVVWTPEMNEYLIANYPISGVASVASYFGIPKQAVIKRASRLGIRSNAYWTQEEDELLRVHFENGSVSYLKSLFPNQSWASILQHGLKVLNLRRLSQTKYSLNYKFMETWSEASAYILGFVMADGHIKYNSGPRNENALQVELADYDVDILEKIKSALSWEGPIARSNRNTVKLNIGSKKLVEDLIKMGIPPVDKTHNAVWPTAIPLEFERHFIRGLMDGDGCICRKANSVCVDLLGTEPLLSSILTKLPINSSVTVRKKTGVDVYSISFSHNKAKSVLSWLYEGATIYLNRKKETYERLSV